MIAIICGISLIAIILIAFIIMNYNRLVRVKNHCDESWRNVDTELKRRYDLIPNLVNVVKGYAKHERELFERVTALREQAMNPNVPMANRAQTEGLLGQALGSLMVRLEAYPQLKADRNFLQLQHELVNTEDRIQASYRLYNGNVRENNNLVEMFPTNIIAGMFSDKFTVRDYFEVQDEQVRQAMQYAPNVEF